MEYILSKHIACKSLSRSMENYMKGTSNGHIEYSLQLKNQFKILKIFLFENVLYSETWKET